MDQPPPEQPTPPQVESNYYRPTVQHGSADKLEALASGYNGLMKVFFLNIGLSLALNLITRTASPDSVWVIWGIALIIVAVSIAALTYPHNKKIGFGKGWAPSGALTASILMGLNSALCCGIIGYIVMQQIALNEIKRYGVRVGGFFGIRNQDIQATLQSMRAQEGNVSPPDV